MPSRTYTTAEMDEFRRQANLPIPAGAVPQRFDNKAMQSAQPTSQGFLNLDPATGLPKMLPTTRSGPGNLGQLIGAPRGSSPSVPGMPSTPVDTYGTVVPGSNPAVPGMNVGPMGNLPNYLLNQAAGGLASDLAGQVPADVQNLLEQQSAEYGVGSGTQGSQFQGYRGLRNLGLTSLDMRKHAEDLLANQFTNPAEQARLNLAQQQFGEGQREFGVTQRQHEREFQASQDLANQRFAAEQNRLQHEQQMQELQALGLKYSGLGGASTGAYGKPLSSGVDYGLSRTSPGQWEPMQFGVTSML